MQPPKHQKIVKTIPSTKSISKTNQEKNNVPHYSDDVDKHAKPQLQKIAIVKSLYKIEKKDLSDYSSEIEEHVKSQLRKITIAKSSNKKMSSVPDCSCEFEESVAFRNNDLNNVTSTSSSTSETGDRSDTVYYQIEGSRKKNVSEIIKPLIKEKKNNEEGSDPLGGHIKIEVNGKAELKKVGRGCRRRWTRR